MKIRTYRFTALLLVFTMISAFILAPNGVSASAITSQAQADHDRDISTNLGLKVKTFDLEVNGQFAVSDHAYLVEGKTYFPAEQVKNLADEYFYTYTPNMANGVISFKDNHTTVTGELNSPDYTRQEDNKKPTKFRADPLRYFDGQVQVPASLFSNLLNYEVSVDGRKRIVTLNNNYPTIVLHGFMGSDKTWDTFDKDLANQYKTTLTVMSISEDATMTEDKPFNYKDKHPVVALRMKDNKTVIVSLADQTRALSLAIEKVRANYGVSRVNIVAHSMGGVVTANYLVDRGDNAPVNKVVTLASPIMAVPGFDLSSPSGVKTYRAVYATNPDMARVVFNAMRFFKAVSSTSSLKYVGSLWMKDPSEYEKLYAGLSRGSIDPRVQVLSFGGKLDVVVPMANGDWDSAFGLLTATANGRGIAVWKGHSGIHESAKINAAIASFLAHDKNNPSTKFLLDNLK